VGGQQRTEAPGDRACRDCHHFLGSSRELEAELPGLTILSSAYGDSMGDQGLCRYHERLVPPGYTCPEFESKE
jgi:hypothetical protein